MYVRISRCRDHRCGTLQSITFEPSDFAWLWSKPCIMMRSSTSAWRPCRTLRYLRPLGRSSKRGRLTHSICLGSGSELATASPGGHATTRSSRSGVKRDRWLSDYLPAAGDGVSGRMRGRVGCSMKPEIFVSTDCSSSTIIFLQSDLWPMPL